MSLSRIVRFIYEHALSMIKPWDNVVIEAITVSQLTSDGFQIVAPTYPEYRVGMKEFEGTIFVSVHNPGINYSSMADDQKEARAIYDEMVDALLAT